MSNISRTGLRRLRVALVGGATLAASLGLAAPQNNSRVPTADTTLPGDSMDRGRFGGEEEPYVAREMLAKQMRRLREEHQKAGVQRYRPAGTVSDCLEVRSG